MAKSGPKPTPETDRGKEAPSSTAAAPGGGDIDALMGHIRREVEQRRSPQQSGLPDESIETGAQAPTQPHLSTDEIMSRVRAEVAHRRGIGTLSGASPASAAEIPLAVREDRLPRWQPAAPRLPDEPKYVLGDFLRFDDADFIDVVYQALLRRPADSKGRQDYLDALRSGAISKVEILGLIRFSEEGRRQGVHVDGLLLPYKLHSWRHKRVIGWFLGMAMAVVRLPRLAWRLQGIEASAARETHEVGHLLDRVDAAVERHFADVDGAINALRSELTQSVMARVDGLRISDARVGALQAAVESVGDSLHASDVERAAFHQTVQERLTVHEDAQHASDAEHAAQHQTVQERLTAREDTSSRIEESIRASAVEHGRQFKAMADRQSVQDAVLAKLNEQARSDQRSLRAMLERLTVFLDVAARQQARGKKKSGKLEPAPESQYASFEDAFRGDREQIKLRVAHYLRTLSSAGINPGDDAVILDLGSGRGEWLEVLTEHGYPCRGVDLDRGMLKASQTRGHEVVEADVLDYLRVQEDGSIAAITSMHLVEHIPHPVLIQLLNEALRVLRAGGVLILETPNPENVRVGSCMFYMDPTHLHPIPPLLLQWVVQARGFEHAMIERLSEHRGSPDLLPVSDNVPGATQINQMIEWFTAPPDYAVIARKPVAR